MSRLKILLFTVIIMVVDVFGAQDAMSQMSDIQISNKGEVRFQNLFTACVHLPFNNAIQLLTDNSFSLKLLPMDSVALDSMGLKEFPVSSFTNDVFINGRHKERQDLKFTRPSKNEISYTYKNVHHMGCSRSHWIESDYYNYYIQTKKNKIRTIQFENVYSKPRGQSHKKYSIDFEYTRFGKVKNIKMSSGEIYYFDYDRKKRIRKIKKVEANYKGSGGQDSIRMIYRIYRFDDHHYIFNESFRHYSYFNYFEKSTPSEEVMSRLNRLFIDVPILKAEIDSLYDLDPYPEDKLDILDSIDIVLEDELDSLIELATDDLMFFHIEFKNNRLVCIDEVDYTSYELDDFQIQDSFIYDKAGQLIKQITYEEMEETYIKDYEYSPLGKLSSLTYYNIDDNRKKQKDYYLQYYYGTKGRISKIRKLEYSEHSEPFDNVIPYYYEE